MQSATHWAQHYLYLVNIGMLVGVSIVEFHLSCKIEPNLRTEINAFLPDKNNEFPAQYFW